MHKKSSKVFKRKRSNNFRVTGRLGAVGGLGPCCPLSSRDTPLYVGEKMSVSVEMQQR